jgi:hypothetical protein
VNRLAHETSPYLRQHAANPVDWYAWGDDAFAVARERDVPVFLSVGYSSCHWCHVMAHESFEDPVTAEVMNTSFVNVKVDREERPDVDAIYMEATQSMTGHGGWPMSVWLTPDGRPFYAGTYFPRTERQGMPSFTRVCAAISDAWRERRADVEGQAEQLLGTIGRSLPAEEAPLDAGMLRAVRDGLRRQFDAQWGGFGDAPKFPPAQSLVFAARQHVREPDAGTLEMITTTLDAMAAGGMHDHVGGGFARYSVDRYWLIPHFEKMLYDNALLTRAYTHGWLVTRAGRYARIVEETIGYVLRDLRHPDGGFFSAEDADSEGVEGKFYVWSLPELQDVCGDDAGEAIRYFGVTEHGNFVDPHTNFRGNVLHAVDRDEEPSDAIRRATAALFARRVERVRPGLDDKVLLAWNALMARALAEAAWAFDRAEWMDAARTNMRFLLERMRRADGRLLRSWQSDAGEARHLAYCEDHAALLEALLTLTEVDSLGWLEPACAIADAMLDLFADPDGGFFTTGRDAPALVVRPQSFMDNATPSENSLAAVALLRLAALTGEARYDEAARSTVARVASLVARFPTAFGTAIEAVERLVEPSIEVVVVGAADDPATQALRREVAGRLVPSSVVVTRFGEHEPEALRALLAGREPVGGRPAGYVCERYACRLPVTDPPALAAELERALSARR